jgi:retron-type reverse transcriptase
MIGLVSVRSLARILGVPRSDLERLARDIDAHYHEWPKTDRRTGKVRAIKSPTPELKNIQRRIVKRLFRTVEFGPEVQGGIHGRSPKTNANMHLGKPWLVAVDVRKFFPSVRHKAVYRMLRDEFGFGRQVAALVMRLVTHAGQLPQGAPTSVVIANLFLRLTVDEPVTAAAKSSGLDYSRFIDDLAFSGNDPHRIINLAARQLTTRQLAISRNEKIKIVPNSRPQEITGLLVNGRRPSISKKRRDRVRAAIHQARDIAEGDQRQRALRSIRGRIAHVRQFNTGAATRLKRQLNSIEQDRRPA